ncbi:MAG: ankyrin repeat domain-containing protein [Planctomycetaceae bacterium]|nr:ankyrin repeat domain-containing protein [Planctomycetaceae bacterium]
MARSTRTHRYCGISGQSKRLGKSIPKLINALRPDIPNPPKVDFNVNAKDINGTTFLFKIVASSKLDAVKYLVENGADVNAKNDSLFQRTPIHAVVESDNLEIVKYLVEKGAGVNAINQKGKTPLDSSFSRS